MVLCGILKQPKESVLIQCRFHFLIFGSFHAAQMARIQVEGYIIYLHNILKTYTRSIQEAMHKNSKWVSASAFIPFIGMVVLSQSSLPVALPTIQREFHANQVSLEWTVNSYLLFIIIFSLIGGKLSDRIGARPVLIYGMILFAMSSILCGVSSDIETLIFMRCLQGFSAALIFPSGTALFYSLFQKSERGRARAISFTISSLFLIAGPYVGGFLTDYFSWRWIFWINWPLAILGVVLISIYFSSSKKKQKILIIKNLHTLQAL